MYFFLQSCERWKTLTWRIPRLTQIEDLFTRFRRWSERREKTPHKAPLPTVDMCNYYTTVSQILKVWQSTRQSGLQKIHKAESSHTNYILRVRWAKPTQRACVLCGTRFVMLCSGHKFRCWIEVTCLDELFLSSIQVRMQVTPEGSFPLNDQLNILRTFSFCWVKQVFVIS